MDSNGLFDRFKGWIRRAGPSKEYAQQLSQLPPPDWALDVEWLIPWHRVESEEGRMGLLRELRKELRKGHALHRIPAAAVATRQDCDDVLFSLNDGRVAIVHLTWTGKAEHAPEYPWTNLFASCEEFISCMKSDHSEWMAS